MQKYKLRKIKFGSFVKLNVIGGMFFGVFVGIIMAVAFFMGAEPAVNVDLFGWTPDLSGPIAAVAGFIICIVSGVFMGFFFALFNYLGLALYLLVFRSLKVNIKISEIADKVDKKAGKVTKKEEAETSVVKAEEETTE